MSCACLLLPEKAIAYVTDACDEFPQTRWGAEPSNQLSAACYVLRATHVRRYYNEHRYTKYSVIIAKVSTFLCQKNKLPSSLLWRGSTRTAYTLEVKFVLTTQQEVRVGRPVQVPAPCTWVNCCVIIEVYTGKKVGI